MPGRKIRNPKTGRLVLASGPTGKKILAGRRKKRVVRSTSTSNTRKYLRCCDECARKARLRSRRKVVYDTDSDSDSDDSDLDLGSRDYVSVADMYL